MDFSSHHGSDEVSYLKYFEFQKLWGTLNLISAMKAFRISKYDDIRLKLGWVSDCVATVQKKLNPDLLVPKTFIQNH